MDDAAIKFASAANEIKLNPMAMEFVPRKGDPFDLLMIVLSSTCLIPILTNTYFEFTSTCTENFSGQEMLGRGSFTWLAMASTKC